MSDYQARNATLAVAGATLRAIWVCRSPIRSRSTTPISNSRGSTRARSASSSRLSNRRARAYLTGRMKAAGGFGAIKLDGDVAFDDQAHRPHAHARGRNRRRERAAWCARTRLHVTLEPFQVRLAKIVAPTLPIGGTVTGTATLDGNTRKRMNVRGDVTHHDVTGEIADRGLRRSYANRWTRSAHQCERCDCSRSRSRQSADSRPRPGCTARSRGPVRLTGPMSSLALDATLTTPDGGLARIARNARPRVEASWATTSPRPRTCSTRARSARRRRALR